MSVRIIVDSASDLTKERADALNLDYMPLKTIFGEIFRRGYHFP